MEDIIYGSKSISEIMSINILSYNYCVQDGKAKLSGLPETKLRYKSISSSKCKL